MTARIHRPTKSAMQSGHARTKRWVLEFPQSEKREIAPLMGYTSSGDTQSQVKLYFDTAEEAVAYALKHGIAYELEEPQTATRKTAVYSDNFRFNRPGQWTH